MPMQVLDHERMRQALSAAESAIGLSDPNPRVGCIVGNDEGQIFGTGHTQAVGQPHAEIVALKAAQQAGARLRDATAWVTLEPCAHQGRTPPCCEALIAAGLSRVVVGMIDPFEKVRGAGIRRLRQAGIRVDLADAEIAAAARYLNVGFVSRMVRRRPWIRMKVAASLDGRTSLPDGKSQWITGELARHDVHHWRKRASAILTGVGSVLADNPRLDVRHVDTAIQPLRVIADTALRTPPVARVVQEPGRVLIATAVPVDRFGVLATLPHVEVVSIPTRNGHVDLEVVIAALTHREANEVHIEAGATFNAAMLATGLVDEMLLYVAPRLLGAGPGIATLSPPYSLETSPLFTVEDVAGIGSDLRIRLLAKSLRAMSEKLTSGQLKFDHGAANH